MAIPLFRALGRRTHAISLLPVILYFRRQFLNAREKCRHLPDVLIADRLTPGRHAGVTNSGADSVIDMPFGIIERVENELRHRRVKRLLERAGFVVERAM